MPAETTRGTRVKACTECRQQKLRCDASENPSQPCSRCRRFGLHCLVTKNFRRVKRRTKSELQAELDSLKQQVQSGPSPVSTQTQSSARIPNPAINVRNSIDASSRMEISSRTRASDTSGGAVAASSATMGGLESSQSLLGNAASSRSSAHVRTTSQTIRDVTVGTEDIDDCFSLFMRHHLTYCPAVDNSLTPNECYAQSPFLFWIIVAIGSRRYTKNPTLIILLAPEVNELAIQAIFAWDPAVYTIIACLFLCKWPMPFDSLFKDMSEVLAGATLQKAMSIGLHVYGVGQDFSRTKLRPDRTQQEFRAKIWALCITTYQRVNLAHGVPPSCIPDTYDYEAYRNDAETALLPSIRFQKKLSRILSEETISIERGALSKLTAARPPALKSLVDAAFSKLAALERECPDMLSKFFLCDSQLQILSFCLFLPRAEMQESKLLQIYSLSCTLIELAMELDHTQQIAEYGPVYVSMTLHLAAFLIMRVARSDLPLALDSSRGQKAYFSAIQFHKKMSVRPEDIAARASMILTQLHTSKSIYRRTDGTLDSLLLRCKSRLGMSVVYDCFWWWRQLFGGQQNPYEDIEEANNTSDMTSNPTSARTPGADSGTFMGIGWSPEMTFPDFQWPVADDFMVDNNWPNFQMGFDPQLETFDNFQIASGTPL